MAKAFKYQNYQIKKGMREGVDYILVTRDILENFVKKYDTRNMDPLDCFRRTGVKQADGEVVCEMKMRKINFLPLPNKTMFKMKQTWFCYTPKSDTVKDLEKKLLRCINYYLFSVRKDSSTMFTKCRLWKT